MYSHSNVLGISYTERRRARRSNHALQVPSRPAWWQPTS